MSEDFEQQVAVMLAGMHPEADHIEIFDFGPISGGMSRETFSFDDGGSLSPRWVPLFTLNP